MRCDDNDEKASQGSAYFNPRTSCEVRRTTKSHTMVTKKISIHAPRVRCDRIERTDSELIRDFNPRTSCEVRPVVKGTCRCHDIISIHAPRVRCDTKFIDLAFSIYISIHAPRVRCDKEKFTPKKHRKYFNPRTSCEVRQE